MKSRAALALAVIAAASLALPVALIHSLAMTLRMAAVACECLCGVVARLAVLILEMGDCEL